jgi:hypothetical protein
MGTPEEREGRSSFCEQKEAKKLYPITRGRHPEHGLQREGMKVLCFFSAKKKGLAYPLKRST